MLALSHDFSLVVASIAISLVAAFTGLAITNNISNLSEGNRKARVVMSAVILGSGIWSMHFVAMLAHGFSVPVYYNSLQTLSSVLIAILMVGTALLLLHFWERTPARLSIAGLIFGSGIVMMHYVGMLAIRGVMPQFSTESVILAVTVAAIAGMVAIHVAYGRRSKQTIVYGAVVFGFSVAAVHYTAMFGTAFQVDPSYQHVPVAMANHTLAMSVTVASFVICGAFLLAATTFITEPRSQSQPFQNVGLKPVYESQAQGEAEEQTQPRIEGRAEGQRESQIENRAADHIGSQTGNASAMPESTAKPAPSTREIPYEKNKKIEYVGVDDVGAIRADGHYSKLYTGSGVLFCPWSIAEAEKTLEPHDFHRTHRSYLVNLRAVVAFEKRKETGVCLFEGLPHISNVPVSRNRVLGLSEKLEKLS